MCNVYSPIIARFNGKKWQKFTLTNVIAFIVLYTKKKYVTGYGQRQVIATERFPPHYFLILVRELLDDLLVIRDDGT